MKRRYNPIPPIDTAGLIVLLVIAAASHGQVFGALIGYRAAIGGVLVGAAVGIVCARWRFSAALTATVAAVAYLVFGPALALPSLCIGGVVPTLLGLQTLVVQSFESWKDLLTLTPPAKFFIGPAVMPYMAGFVCALVSLTVALRPLWGRKKRDRRLLLSNASDTRRDPKRTIHPPGSALAVIPAVVLLAVGIAWGVRSAHATLGIGIAFIVVCLAWLAWRHVRRGMERGTVVARINNSKRTVQRGVLVVAVLGMCSAIAAGAVFALGLGSQRDVLRDHIVPPLDLHDYPSPLADFRHIIKDQEKTVLFSVKGLPEGSRLRLAAMDFYNGEVYNISEQSQAGSGFKNIGSTVEPMPRQPNSVRTKLNITVKNYSRHWVLGGGNLHSLTYSMPHAKPYQDALFYDRDLATIMSSKAMAAGVRYREDVELPRQWKQDQLAGQKFAQVDMPKNVDVPQVINEKLPEVLSGIEKPLDKVRAIERYFRDNGYFSNGKDGMSDAGHRTERIKRLMSEDVMIGDDEQYSVAMALMAREAGMPARVVMGFYPPEGKKVGAKDTWKVTGNDVHAWVEVKFQTAGWVPFDPTPPRDKVPQTTVPKPKKTPNPLVLQPPQPPPTPAELHVDPLDDSSDKESVLWKILAFIWEAVKIGFWIFLALLPFIAILLFKRRRRTRRRFAADKEARYSGLWDEVVDRAWDCGIDVPAQMTRWQQAVRITYDMNPDIPARATRPDERGGLSPVIPPPEKAVGDGLFMLAAQVDAATYGHQGDDGEALTKAWEYADKLEDEMRRPLPAWRRAASRFWLTSLVRRARLNAGKESMRSKLRTRWAQMRARLGRKKENNDGTA